MVIEETCDLIRERYGNRLERIIVRDIRIGFYLTAVRLSDGSAGAAATLSSLSPFCQKGDRDFGVLTPSKVKGAGVTGILESEKVSGVLPSVRLAVLNALSAAIIERGDYNIYGDTDPLDFVDLSPGKVISIVGAFQSYIRKVSSSGCRLNVLEMNENALGAGQKDYYVPAGEFRDVLPLSDAVIITGQTLVNGTIDELLSAVNEKSQVIVTGPSSGLLPDILFRKRVSIMGAARITDPDLLFDVVGEGGTGYHLFRYCAEKICIKK